MKMLTPEELRDLLLRYDARHEVGCPQYKEIREKDRPPNTSGKPYWCGLDELLMKTGDQS